VGSLTKGEEERVSEKVETIILEARRCNCDARRTKRVRDTLCGHARDLKRRRGFIASLVTWNRDVHEEALSQQRSDRH
jgi:hypothetical protein